MSDLTNFPRTVEPLLSVASVSSWLGWSPASIIRLANEGRIDCVSVKFKRKTSRRFAPSVVEQFLREHSPVPVQSEATGEGAPSQAPHSTVEWPPQLP